MDVREDIRQMASTLALEDGFELVDVEWLVQGGRRTVRVLLDRPEGIQVGDCAKFSRRLSDVLDMNQTLQGRYQLEVSSPGIERPLRTLDSLQRFVGRRVAMTTVLAHEGRRHFEGELLPPGADRVGLRAEGGTEHWFDWNGIKDAHLVVDPWADKRGGSR